MANNFTVNGTNLDNLLVPKSAVWQPGEQKLLWSWGGNGYGQLGLGDLAEKSSPVQVGSLTNWSTVSCNGKSTIAIRTNGTLWVWGNNGAGQLGQNISLNITTSYPAQLGTLTNWSTVSGGYNSNLSVKTDGTLWTWGYNVYHGQLGLGDTVSRSSPVQVGSLTNWSLVSGGLYSTIAIKTDGTLWSWGKNDYGQLGLGDRTHRSSPVQVGSLTNWAQASGGSYYNTAAIKTDGTLWTWGRNYGQLGLGDMAHRSSPVQVGSLTNWSKVSYSYNSAYAIKTDGTLWAWGSNYAGQLGLGDRTESSSPVQVGTLTNWSSVSCHQNFAYALKTDGTLWSWGKNDYPVRGQLGLGDITHRSSPVQIGSLTNWSKIPTTYCASASFAIQQI